MVEEKDTGRFLTMFDEINDYHTIGSSIFRINLDGRTIWADAKVRLLEKYEGHRVFFAVIDDITKSMEEVAKQ